jgi:hypothetical protein
MKQKANCQFCTLSAMLMLVLTQFGIAFITAPPARAQSLFEVLIQTDLSSQCNPAANNEDDNNLPAAVYGCCGSPGRRECGEDLNYTKWLSTGCTNPPSKRLSGEHRGM